MLIHSFSVIFLFIFFNKSIPITYFCKIDLFFYPKLYSVVCSVTSFVQSFAEIRDLPT